jgi:pimeloyl-ACP methyl ester carboxylesterase
MSKTLPEKYAYHRRPFRLLGLFLGLLSVSFVRAAETPANMAEAIVPSAANQTLYKTTKIEGLDIFYREAGPPGAPTIVLLHGFPTSSHMFRHLIPQLADRYHLIAPDYPGFGQSSMPLPSEFSYTFDHLANVIDKLLQKLGIEQYSLYVMDYGAPVGYRIAVQHPERVQALIVQNGNAYEEGLGEFWGVLKSYWKDRSETEAAELRKSFTLESIRWQYTHGVRQVEKISPDNWVHDAALLSRPGNEQVQLALFFDYGSNLARYPEWQAFFRERQPPTLIVWGKNDFIFPAAGAEPYRRDLKNLEFHLLDTGHFALEEDGDLIAQLIRSFLAREKL